MSERKTAEIKFRCTPTFKSGLQAQAEAEGISASQLIENAVQTHIWAEQNKRLDGLALTLTDNALAANRDDEDGAATPEQLDVDESQFSTILMALQCKCRPWEFCTHKAPA